MSSAINPFTVIMNMRHTLKVVFSPASYFVQLRVTDASTNTVYPSNSKVIVVTVPVGGRVSLAKHSPFIPIVA